MVDDPKVAKELRRLEALPPELRRLAEYAWSNLRPAIENQAITLGVDPSTAEQIGARLARLVVSQLYGDVKRYRLLLPRT